MRIKSKRLLYTMILAFSIVFISCSENDEFQENEVGYSIGDFIVSFGIIEKTVDNYYGYTVKLDNKSTVVPLNTNLPDIETRDNMRVLIQFSPIDDEIDEEGQITYFAQIDEMTEILYKDIETIPSEEQFIVHPYGEDPIDVNNAWQANGIINFDIQIFRDHESHSINLVRTDESTVGNEPIILELCHNAYDDEKSEIYQNFISFNLESLKQEGQESIEYFVHYTNYEGEYKTIGGTYNYNEDYTDVSNTLTISNQQYYSFIPFKDLLN